MPSRKENSEGPGIEFLESSLSCRNARRLTDWIADVGNLGSESCRFVMKAGKNREIIFFRKCLSRNFRKHGSEDMNDAHFLELVLFRLSESAWISVIRRPSRTISRDDRSIGLEVTS
jgi:hypothetical protein